MDNQKDIQKVDGIGRFLDDFHPKTNPFGHNRIGERAYRRAERLCAAIVLLTNHVHEHDPLRLSARQLSVSMITNVLLIRDEMRAMNSDKVIELKALVRNLISVMRLLAVAGMVSMQNAESVIEALDGLTEFIHASQKSNLAESILITREDLIDVRETIHRQERTHIETQRDKEGVHAAVANNQGPQGLKTETYSLSDMGARALSIIEILRNGKELGIREIASNLPEYSEKMIQRELAELVRFGKVKKEGLKRWSRYSIVV